MDWLTQERGLPMDSWEDLHEWSITEIEDFWESIWHYFGVRSRTPYRAVLTDRRMPGADWFPGATFNYAEHLLGLPEDADRTAIVGISESRPRLDLTFAELAEHVRAARNALIDMGVKRDTVVAAYLPNIPETLVIFAACASLGAVFASCAPEFGTASVVDRFSQIAPEILFGVDGYRFGGKDFDRRAALTQIASELPSVRHAVSVSLIGSDLTATGSWTEHLHQGQQDPTPLTFEAVPFGHPLYVLFSSGTTGRPKAIIHGHGGVLLEHLKNHALHWDLRPRDRLQWFSTTSWMIWNAAVSALLVRASIVMIDGNPVHPDLSLQWKIAEETGATLLGLSTAFVHACVNSSFNPRETTDLSRIRQVGVVGSPLSIDGYLWVNEQFGDDVVLNVGSGGTDVCTGIVQGSPMQPVWLGEMSGSSLGIPAAAYSPEGDNVVGELGELVITLPIPSMPVGLWGDLSGELYRETYFDLFPGVWRHGDWIRFNQRGSCVITGRSDATLNRGGVRLGTADFYGVIESLTGVADSLVVHLEDPSGGPGRLILFVQTSPGVPLDDELRGQIVRALRTSLSPRHVPDEIVEIEEVPHNRTGKKLEVPVKRILQGWSIDDAAARDSLANPDALAYFIGYSQSQNASDTSRLQT
jgi:acetoacetyl-CoA synthetase